MYTINKTIHCTLKNFNYSGKMYIHKIVQNKTTFSIDQVT